MKKAILWALLTLLPLSFINGCVQGTATTHPQNLNTRAPEPDDAAPADDTVLAAPYYYLAARRHLNKGELELAEAALGAAIEKDQESSFLKREMIRLLQGQKKTDMALDMAEKLAEQFPDNVDNLLLLARLKKGSDSELTALFKQILKLAPDNRETYLRLGKIYMDGEKPSEALELFTKMVNVFPDYYVAHFYLGEAQLLTGAKKQAQTSFLKTLELEPELVEPRFRLIDIYREGNTKKARKKILAQYTEILKMEPGNDRALLELALFHYKNKAKKKADELFGRLGQELKENPRLAMAAVDAFISRKRYEDAVIVFSRLREAAPANTGLNFFLAMAHEALDHRDEAIEYYLKVPPEHPQYKKAMLSIAFLHRDQDRMDEAVKFLEYHHSQNPADIDILSYLASFYDEEQRYEEAMTLLQTGLKQSPENTALMFKLGATQDKAGLRDDCIKTMKALLRVDPDHAGALNYLGYTYAEMGIFLDEALDLVQRALKIKPGDGYITDSLGWIFFKKEAYDQAILHLEKAAEISKYETIIADHLADAYAKNGQPQKALATYKKALANAQEDQQDLIKKIKAKVKALEQRPDETQ
ncbi:MAG: tetratricopeptide repeat protein [Desulfobacter sp.]|nr:MAG: tetratricopeptide repeat protein [Desulfobacter sp.]